MKPIFLASLLFLLSLSSLSCGGNSRPIPPRIPETFEQRLQRLENVSCAQITYHDYGDAPDCQRIYEAWVRGRNRVSRIYPLASEMRMSGVSFYRPRLMQVPEREYPLLADVPGNPRGVTYISGGLQIVYSYEEIVEHEAVHALVFLVDGLKVREAQMAEQDMGGYQPGDFQHLPFYFYLVACHGTPDDPFGESGNRGSCVDPFRGPPDWRTRVGP
jgi:hypothetical protein